MTFGASLLALGLAACGGDDTAAGPADASTASAEGGSSSGSTSSSGGDASSSSSSSSSGSVGDAGDAGTTTTYSVGGKVTGLAGSGLVLQNNGGDDLVVTSNGTFTFAKALPSGGAYEVTVKSQPTSPAQTCVVSGGVGAVGKADVTSVVVNCAADTYTVGGTATGLTGNAVLQNNGGDDLVVNANGTFAFPTPLGDDQPYAVTLKTSPPGESCVLANASGKISAANVVDITLTCSPDTYTIGGTLLGLGDGKTIQIANNAGDPLILTTNGTFTFPKELAGGETYSVTTVSQPADQTCTVSGGKGTVGTADVTSVVVNCEDGAYTLGGTVTGLSGTLVLQSSGKEVSVTANGDFAFPGTLSNGTAYNVSVKAAPTGQTCLVANAIGTVSGANVTNVAVSCTTNQYTVGGVVTGLSGTLILQNNGGDNLTLKASGGFAFKASIPYGDTYNVTVKNQPNGQVCTVTSGSGVVGTTNVNNVEITCENKRTIGGAATGLSGASPVVLQNNGGDDLTVTVDGPFVFATPLSEGQTYDVTVKTAPTDRTCTVSSGSGTVGKQNVTNVDVTCVPVP